MYNTEESKSVSNSIAENNTFLFQAKKTFSSTKNPNSKVA